MDSSLIRKQFSALKNDWILFENAGGTQVPDQVIHRISEFYRTNNVQPDYLFSKARDCKKILQEARQFVADWIGASSADQVAFGPSATALNRIAAVALSQRWQEGDEIIVTISDHEANITPWIYLEKDFGLKVRFWNVNQDTFELELKDLENLLTEKTVLVAFPHISNILGMENPVSQITELVHDAGAWVYVDGVASTPHQIIDVENWDVDFFVFSTYKTFGPHLAALYVKREIFEELKNINHFFLNKIPRKFELGTPNLEGFSALLGIKEYFETVFGYKPNSLNREMLINIMKNIQEYESILTKKLLSGLSQISKIRILGAASSSRLEKRVPIFSFDIDGIKPEFIHKYLGERKIAAGTGHFYAYRLVDSYGLIDKGGVTRVSLVHYNTSDEIDRFLQELDKLV